MGLEPRINFDAEAIVPQNQCTIASARNGPHSYSKLIVTQVRSLTEMSDRPAQCSLLVSYCVYIYTTFRIHRKIQCNQSSWLLAGVAELGWGTAVSSSHHYQNA
jgi:hypothetical protein